MPRNPGILMNNPEIHSIRQGQGRKPRKSKQNASNQANLLPLCLRGQHDCPISSFEGLLVFICRDFRQAAELADKKVLARGIKTFYNNYDDNVMTNIARQQEDEDDERQSIPS